MLGSGPHRTHDRVFSVSWVWWTTHTHTHMHTHAHTSAHLCKLYRPKNRIIKGHATAQAVSCSYSTVVARIQFQVKSYENFSGQNDTCTDFLWELLFPQSQDSGVSIVIGFGLDSRCAIVQVLFGQEFSILHTGSWAHTVSYPMGMGGLLPHGLQNIYIYIFIKILNFVRNIGCP
jgi:hypothetical protein